MFHASHDDKNSDLFDYLSYGPFNSIDEYKLWMNTGSYTHPDTTIYVVRNRSSSSQLSHSDVEAWGDVVGVCGYLAHSPSHKHVELGHLWITPAWQRTHVNTEMCYLMLKYAFDVLGYVRVEWKTDIRNEKSQRAAKRLGFVQEGVFRKHRIGKSGVSDSVYFSMVDDEWPQRRNWLESKLESAAFAYTC